MKIRYGGWLKKLLGCDEEEFVLPETVTTVGALLDWLPGRSERHEKALEHSGVFIVSVNWRYARRPDPVADKDEVLLMPPMAGG
ncbi:MAG: MoaD/ThiS family protein [Azonexus sp.]|jgi:molybdopterin converting factor small subunit|nr:MoaD/ThiS family protein [Azonexus sp.]